MRSEPTAGCDTSNGPVTSPFFGDSCSGLLLRVVSSSGVIDNSGLFDGLGGGVGGPLVWFTVVCWGGSSAAGTCSKLGSGTCGDATSGKDVALSRRRSLGTLAEETAGAASIIRHESGSAARLLWLGSRRLRFKRWSVNALIARCLASRLLKRLIMSTSLVTVPLSESSDGRHFEVLDGGSVSSSAFSVG